MDRLSDAVEKRLEFWEAQLAQAALDNEDEHAKLCERFIQEYTTLLEAAKLGSGTSASGLDTPLR